MKMVKSFLVVLLCLCMVLPLFPAVKAEAATVTQDQSARAVTSTVKPGAVGTLKKVNGQWRYYVNGTFMCSTTLVKYSGEWYYVQNGVVNPSLTNLVKYNGEWRYVVKGKVASATTGLVKYNGEWWYVVKGKVASATTTLVKYNGEWWYVVKGKIAGKTSTLVKFNGSWYYICKGKLAAKTTTLVKFNGVWYYVDSGKVNFRDTALVAYSGNSYYVRNGIAQMKLNGKVVVNNTPYYIRNGILTSCHRTGHQWNNWITIERPSINSTGIAQRICIQCTIVETKDVDHSNACPRSAVRYSHGVATCTEGAYSFYICTDCGYSYIAEVLPPLGHCWTNWKTITEQTQTAPGIRTRICESCGLSETEPFHICHYMKVITEEATCNKGGLYEMVCTICAKVSEVNESDALGHDWDNIPPVTYQRVWIVCPHCDAYLCELDETCDPNDALWAHIQENGGDWWNHSWTSDSETIIVEQSKIRCTRCNLIRVYNPEKGQYVDEVKRIYNANIVE